MTIRLLQKHALNISRLSFRAPLFITAIIWTVLAIYWGALWKTPELIHHLNGWVVVRALPFLSASIADSCVKDFDGGELGSSVSQYLAAIHDKEAVTWHVKSAALFPNGPIDLAHMPL